MAELHVITESDDKKKSLGIHWNSPLVRCGSCIQICSPYLSALRIRFQAFSFHVIFSQMSGGEVELLFMSHLKSILRPSHTRVSVYGDPEA